MKAVAGISDPGFSGPVHPAARSRTVPATFTGDLSGVDSGNRIRHLSDEASGREISIWADFPRAERCVSGEALRDPDQRSHFVCARHGYQKPLGIYGGLFKGLHGLA